MYLKFFSIKNEPVISRAISKSIGFITFDHKGVLAANNIFQLIRPTIKTKASGQFVINQVIFHIPFTFFNAESINSILNQTKNINTIIHDAHKNDSFTSHHIINQDQMKKSNVIAQITKSNLCNDSNKSFFIY